MKRIDLDLSKEEVIIELSTSDYGRDVLEICLFDGDEPLKTNKDSQLMIEIQREPTLKTTTVSIYSEEKKCFIYSVKKSWVDTVGEKPAQLSLVDVFEETKDVYPAKWVVTE